METWGCNESCPLTKAFTTMSTVIKGLKVQQWLLCSIYCFTCHYTENKIALISGLKTVWNNFMTYTHFCNTNQDFVIYYPSSVKFQSQVSKR